MWIVTFKGVELDIDPLDLDMKTFAEMEQRAGFSGYADFSTKLSYWDPNMWAVLYWAAMRRAGLDPGPFGDFEGPTFREVFSQRDRLEESIGEMALFMGMDPKALAGPDGSPTSEPSTAGAPPSDSTP